MPVSLILIVEDEPLLRMLAASFLEEAGFETVGVGSADEAMDQLESRPDIRVVFADINLPGSMDGLRLAHVIRDRWPPIGLVTTSGHAMVHDADLPERGLFLGKPYEKSALVGMMRALMQ
jgi:two-component system, response regulator PdtaR